MNNFVNLKKTRMTACLSCFSNREVLLQINPTQNATRLLPRTSSAQSVFQLVRSLIHHTAITLNIYRGCKMWIEIVSILIILFLITKLFGSRSKNKNSLPPGPYQWPIVGNLPQVVSANPDFPHLAFEKLSRKYGDIISLKFGVHNAILLSSYTAIRDLLSKDEFSGRYEGFPYATDRSFGKAMGLVFTSGPEWRTVRRFTTRTLRDYGFGKRNSMSNTMNEEFADFFAVLESKADNGVIKITPELFSISFVNILWSYVAGYRFSHADNRLHNILKLNDRVISIWNHSSFTVPFPVLRYWVPGDGNINRHLEVYNELHSFMKNLISQVETNYMKESAGSPRTFLECFIQEIHDNAQEGKDATEETFFTVNQLSMVLQDLFLGGSETTSNTITYAILYMILNPDVQQKVYDEIQQICQDDHQNPHNNIISLTDLARMPYTEATIQEIFRFSHVVPITAARKCMEDYKYRDYFIPKDTCIFVNLSAVLMDKQLWGDPENFRPERFLSSDGTKVVNTEKMVPFGFGKRVCIAESMARESFFLFFTGLLKKYKLQVPPRNGQKLPSTDPMTKMFTLRPHPFEVLITPRN